MNVPSRSGRLVADVAASVCGVLLLLVVLAAFNERFREQFSQGASTDGAGVAALDQINNVTLLIGLMVAQVVREQSVEHVSLMAFAGAALVFVIFLLRM